MNAPPIHHTRDVERHQTAYHHLETDAEFKARLLAAGHTKVTVITVPKRGKNETFEDWFHKYRRTGETESRFLSRRTTPETIQLAWLLGEELDRLVWDALRIQRRIVTVTPS